MAKPTTAALALCGVIGGIVGATFGGLPVAGGPALAQGSVGAPAGMDPATAPGGTEGQAGLRNEREAVRSGDAVPVPPPPPPAGRIAVDPPAQPVEDPRAPQRP